MVLCRRAVAVQLEFEPRERTPRAWPRDTRAASASSVGNRTSSSRPQSVPRFVRSSGVRSGVRCANRHDRHTAARVGAQRCVRSPHQIARGRESGRCHSPAKCCEQSFHFWFRGSCACSSTASRAAAQARPSRSQATPAQTPHPATQRPRRAIAKTSTGHRANIAPRASASAADRYLVGLAR